MRQPQGGPVSAAVLTVVATSVGLGATIAVTVIPSLSFAYRAPALLTAPERGALGLVDSCVSVTRTLDATLAAYGTLVTDKSKVVLVKDVFDRINNNRQLTC